MYWIIALVVVAAIYYFGFYKKDSSSGSSSDSSSSNSGSSGSGDSPSDSSSSNSGSSGTSASGQSSSNSTTIDTSKYGIVMYKDAGYKSTSKPLTYGDYTKLPGTFFGVSSMKITGKMRVTLYDQENYQGDSIEVLGPFDYPSLAQNKGFPKDFMDRIRSVKMSIISTFTASDGDGKCPTDSTIKPKQSVQLFYDSSKYFAIPLKAGVYDFRGCNKTAMTKISKIIVNNDNYAIKINYANGGVSKQLKGADIKPLKAVRIDTIEVFDKSPFGNVLPLFKSTFGNVLPVIDAKSLKSTFGNVLPVINAKSLKSTFGF